MVLLSSTGMQCFPLSHISLVRTCISSKRCWVNSLSTCLSSHPVTSEARKSLTLRAPSGSWRRGDSVSPVARRFTVLCTAEETGNGGYQERKPPPQEAVLKAISGLSSAEGRVPLTTNVVMGGTETSTVQQMSLDERVNVYPQHRRFQIIGTGGDDFVRQVVETVESVLSTTVPADCVSQRLSAKGKYVSVHIEPVLVRSSEEVRAVYDAMRKDSRMKYFI